VTDDRNTADRLAADSLGGGDATGWFDRLYAAAERGEAVIPWDDGEAHPQLVEWARERMLDGTGKRALVVGSGYGDDAEYVAGLGFDTVAFDIAPTAVRAAVEKFSGSPVQYVTADLLDPPETWRRSFDLVVEIITVQSLPDDLRPKAIAEVAGMVAPGGTLLVISTAREDEDAPWDGPPWPLKRAEVESFAAQDDDLRVVGIERIEGGGGPFPSRWRAEFRRPEREIEGRPGTPT
jgi:SAM-dependent methyltransferase